MVVPIENIIQQNDFYSRRDVMLMKQVLIKQGQIEPLQVRPYTPIQFITFAEDVHGAALVQAARELNWPTLLIVEMKRYRS
jgi:hypothetical protein